MATKGERDDENVVFKMWAFYYYRRGSMDIGG